MQSIEFEIMKTLIDVMTELRDARGELVFSLEICANGQEYYRVGGDGSGDRKEEVFLGKKQFDI